MKKIKIYGTPICPNCNILKKILKDNNINFEYIDLSSDPKLIDMVIKKTNQRTIPIINIDKEWIAGFDKEKIFKLLNIPL